MKFFEKDKNNELPETGICETNTAGIGINEVNNTNIGIAEASSGYKIPNSFKQDVFKPSNAELVDMPLLSYGAGMLTGDGIKKQMDHGRIEIDPFNESQMNPNSYNLRLHPQLKVYKRGFREEKDLNIIPNETKHPNATIDVTPRYANSARNKVPNLENLRMYNTHRLHPIDMDKDNEYIELNITDKGLVLLPGILYIGRTVERTKSDYFIPMINGRSSSGRLGLSVHITAGFGDIGFDGTWTLEITVVEPLIVYPNKEIAQVNFFTPYGDITTKYNGRYQRQEEATTSRLFKGKLTDESI